MTSALPVAVVGGGIGGMAAALALALREPKLLGLEESRRRAVALVAEAKAALTPWSDGLAGGRAAPLLALADFITGRDR